MKSMYQKNIMEHYHNSRFRGSLANPTFTVHEYNPSCGDEITLDIILDNQTIKDIRFSGTGCIISQAAASLLAEQTVDVPCEKILSLTEKYIENLLVIPLGPLRLKCALMPLKALQTGVSSYYKK